MTDEELEQRIDPGRAAPSPTTTRRLEAGESRYRAVVEAGTRAGRLPVALHEGILVRGRDGTVLACNAAATEILGLRADELIGAARGLGLRMLRDDGTEFPPGDLPSSVTFRTGETASALIGLERPTGERIWLSLTAQPLIDPGASEPDALVISFFDVTERQDAERALQAAETRYRTLVEQIPAATHISALDETASTI